MSNEIVEKLRKMTKQAVMNGLTIEEREDLLRAFKIEDIDTGIISAYLNSKEK